jgi:hypothetical protein
MEVFGVLLVLVIFISIINLSSYLRQMNENMSKIYNLLKDKK